MMSTMTQTETIQILSARDLLNLGLQEVAYVKPLDVDGEPAFAVHAADGTQIAITKERALAHAMLRQHDLEPLSVH